VPGSGIGPISGGEPLGWNERTVVAVPLLIAENPLAKDPALVRTISV
jgi:hypothetical protein